MSRVRLVALLVGLAACLLLHTPRPARAQGFTVEAGPYFTPREEAEMEARLRADLDTLTFDHARAAYRSRHALRPETYLESIPFLLRRISDLRNVPFPEQRFRDAIRGETEAFRADVPDGRSFPLVNLRAPRYPRVENPRPKVVVCTHYDSDGFLSGPGWRADRDPAPGADDAGSGCVALIELARQIAGLQLPFNVEFMFFGGEELGLLGSEHEAALMAQRGDSILAVINLDQLAYAPRLDSLFVVADSNSAWLADSLVAVSHRAWTTGPALVPVVLRQRTNNSDHYSYQLRGFPAVMLAEAARPSEVNPTTETVADTLGNVSISAVRHAVELVAAWIKELAFPILELQPVGWGDNWMCGAAALPAQGDTLHVPGTVGRVLAGRLERRLIGAFSVIERTGDVRSNNCARGLYPPSRTLRVARPDFRPGSIIHAPPVDIPLAREDFGRLVYGQDWTYAPDGIHGASMGAWQVLLDLPQARVGAWDLGPVRNPVFARSVENGIVSHVLLRGGTTLNVQVVDASGRSLQDGQRKSVGDSGPGRVLLLDQFQVPDLRSGVYYYRLTLSDGRTSRGRFVYLR